MLKISFILLPVALVVIPVLAINADQEQVVNVDKECTVSLKNGRVNGVLTPTQNFKEKVCAYMGIPYAWPPVGELRFQAPRPARTLGTLNATSPPNMCPQAGSAPAGVKFSEDCLYLNVYQPRLEKRKGQAFPVMIWFHGGGFASGGSLPYTPIKLLARGDVILVVVQYRLGLLGFLSTGDTMVPGNNGLKDQAFSIKWANENIQAFGGNSKNIIVFGESAGAASVNFQLISPLNKGLIQGVIAQSGVALASWALDRNPEASAKLMAKRLGCSTQAKFTMVACLKRLKWQKIVKEQNAYSVQSFQNMSYPYATLTPVIEPKNTNDAFISEEPALLMKSASISNIPVMLGTNKHEGSFTLGFMYLLAYGPQELDKNATYMREQIVPDILKFANDKDSKNRAVASTVELAFLSGVNRSSWDESMPGLVDAMSVLGFKSPIQDTADILSGKNKRVYLYSFEHKSNNSLWSSFFKGIPIPVKHGITHGDELMYLFHFPATFTSQDQTVSDIMCDMWINFAKTGNPTPSTDKRFAKWQPYNSVKEPYMQLDAKPTMQFGFRKSWRPNGFQWESNDVHV